MFLTSWIFRNPGNKFPVWALSASLAATREIDISFSSSRYLDVSVPWVCPPIDYVFIYGYWGLPQ